MAFNHKKHTRKRIRGDQDRDKSPSKFWGTVGYFVMWLAIFVIGSLIVSAIIDPSVGTEISERFSEVKDNVVDLGESVVENSRAGGGSIEEDPLVASCLIEWNKYAEAGEEKWENINHKITESRKINSESELEEFYDLYGAFGLYPVELAHNDWNNEYPIVLILSKVKSASGSITVMSLCDSDGELTMSSKSSLRI